MTVHTILYVADQRRSTVFYAAVLATAATLDVPGMTEFQLGAGHILGLMPEQGIRRLLGDSCPDPAGASGIPRVELYFRVTDPESMFQRAKDAGARELSPIQARGWGDRAGYLMDPDGHVLAMASGGAGIREPSGA